MRSHQHEKSPPPIWREYAGSGRDGRYVEGPALADTDLSLGRGWSSAEKVSENVTRRLVEAYLSRPGPGQTDALLERLTDRERDMLRLLAATPGETVPRQTLAGNDGAIGERAVDVQINRLRRKIEHDPANPLLVQTVRGIGYRLVTTP